jgi:hypothetical protein
MKIEEILKTKKFKLQAENSILWLVSAKNSEKIIGVEDKKGFEGIEINVNKKLEVISVFL